MKLNNFFEKLIGELWVKCLLWFKFILSIVFFGFNIVKYIVILVCEFEWGWIFVCFVLNNCLVLLIVICFILLIIW